MINDSDFVKYVAKLVIQEIEQMGYTTEKSSTKMVPVGISARHVHLQTDHLELLFGKGYKLTHARDLSQPGQFAAKETVSLLGTRGKIDRIRILGPVRNSTQVEIAASDARTLGVPPVVRNSGDHYGTPGLTIIGPNGSIELIRGVILADRHIHMSPRDAESFCVKNGDRVKVLISGPRKGIIDNVAIRVNEEYRLDLHIDTDEANAFLLNQGDELELIK